MATMLFYHSVKALNRELHRKLCLKRTENPFGFAAKTNSVLIAASEFAEASRDYPIVFVGSGNGFYGAAALVGLRDSENLFVDTQGYWRHHSYVPAFVRRYPFVLAEDGEQLTVCIDETFAGLGEKDGIALFEKNGEESAFFKEVLGFLHSFHVDMQRTKLFADKLAELGLLVPKTIALQEKTNKQMLDGLWVVDEEKLAALSENQIVELHRNGYLAAIHAHLLSLNNVGRLAEPVTVTATATATTVTTLTTAAVEKNSEPVQKPDSAKKVKNGTH